MELFHTTSIGKVATAHTLCRPEFHVRRKVISGRGLITPSDASMKSTAHQAASFTTPASIFSPTIFPLHVTMTGGAASPNG